MSIVWVIFLLMGGIFAWSMRRARASKVKTNEEMTRCSSSQNEREAHYMKNFWNYDGSEQQDWDEEG